MKYIYRFPNCKHKKNNQEQGNNETRLIVTYNVEDVSNPIPLFVGAESVGFSASAIYDKIEIDNVEIDMSDLSSSEEYDMTVYSYQLTSGGQHTVKYTLKDPTMIGAEVDEETHMPSKLSATFMTCPITSVEIPDSITSIGQQAFCDCSGLTSVTIGSGVTRIGDYAFTGCTRLASITIPSGVTNIDYCAFQNCRSLTSVTIPDSVTSIGSSAFNNCSGLTSVTIGNGVENIDYLAFGYCSELENITSLATTAPTIQSDTFQNIKTNGTLIVPNDSSGYNVWMQSANYYLGKYGWILIEQ